jgi:hypothetical protein
MLAVIRKMFRDMFTEPDGESFCPVRLAAGLANVTYHAAAAAGIYMGQLHLDIATLGQYLQHMSMLIGVGGVSVGAKSVMKGDTSNAGTVDSQ